MSSFSLSLCVCFLVLVISATFSQVGRVDLYSRYPGSPLAQSPWSPELGLQECPLGGLCVPSCYSCAVIVVGISVVGVDLQVEGFEY